MAVARGLLAGLADLGVEPEVGDELARIPEPADVADAGHERRSRVQVDPGHGHQPAHLLGVDRGLGEIPVDQRELLMADNVLHIVLPVAAFAAGLAPPQDRARVSTPRTT